MEPQNPLAQLENSHENSYGYIEEHLLEWLASYLNFT